MLNGLLLYYDGVQQNELFAASICMSLLVLGRKSGTLPFRTWAAFKTYSMLKKSRRQTNTLQKQFQEKQKKSPIINKSPREGIATDGTTAKTDSGRSLSKLSAKLKEKTTLMGPHNIVRKFGEEHGRDKVDNSKQIIGQSTNVKESVILDFINIARKYSKLSMKPFPLRNIVRNPEDDKEFDVLDVDIAEYLHESTALIKGSLSTLQQRDLVLSVFNERTSLFYDILNTVLSDIELLEKENDEKIIVKEGLTRRASILERNSSIRRHPGSYKKSHNMLSSGHSLFHKHTSSAVSKDASYKGDHAESTYEEAAEEVEVMNDEDSIRFRSEKRNKVAPL